MLRCNCSLIVSRSCLGVVTPRLKILHNLCGIGKRLVMAMAPRVKMHFLREYSLHLPCHQIQQL